MNVIVQSKTVVVTKAIRAYAVRQAQRLVNHGGKILRVTIFLENVAKKKNDVQGATAKFLVTVPGRRILVQERAKNLYTAMTEAARVTVQQVEKTQVRMRRRSRLARVVVPVEKIGARR